MAYDRAERNPVADVWPADVLETRKKRYYARVDAKELPALLAAIDGHVSGAQRLTHHADVRSGRSERFPM